MYKMVMNNSSLVAIQQIDWLCKPGRCLSFRGICEFCRSVSWEEKPRKEIFGWCKSFAGTSMEEEEKAATAQLTFQSPSWLTLGILQLCTETKLSLKGQQISRQLVHLSSWKALIKNGKLEVGFGSSHHTHTVLNHFSTISEHLLTLTLECSMYVLSLFNIEKLYPYKNNKKEECQRAYYFISAFAFHFPDTEEP